MKRPKHEGKVKERVAAREAAIIASQQGLKQTTRDIEAKEAKIAAESSVEKISAQLAFNYGSKAIRGINTFNRSLKSKDIGKIKLAVATHMFGKYKVPSYMQDCWYSEHVVRNRPVRDAVGDWWGRRRATEEVTLVAHPEISMRRDWYITQATGGSLFKEHAKGILTKAEGTDPWTIDLAAPCFAGACAQDWASFVVKINPNAGDPSQYIQPAANEHKVFGCDLWVETTGVNPTT